MNWLAILLSLASLGGGTPPSAEPVKRECKAASAAARCEAAKPKQPPKANKKKPGSKAKPRKAPRIRTKPPASKPRAGQPPTQDARPVPREETPATVTPPARGPQPEATATPTPAPGATATPTPTPAPPSNLPRRTAVDLLEWDIRSSYLTLAAGRVTFNANNLGEDEHNLAVRGGGREYGKLDLLPGENGPLVLELAAGSYTLYCSLIGHEAAGMRLPISVR